ncbi:hypothetical protein AMTRI_Chr02g262720 [Amborella trichopoda]|uniref:uncharacterized protein LOC18431387 isoform X2 n=1 Tax=Amborella trichopoda TaxID=13333 RepID=UPI0009BDC02F|nr:uncharacterized protein LOC18431387 isoform X2 [Amborella trichopoda]|eukprot:XP_011622268.2 uncharacterized protein LOC18431387 isoform X2 [Amborella trichopoda]
MQKDITRPKFSFNIPLNLFPPPFLSLNLFPPSLAIMSTACVWMAWPTLLSRSRGSRNWMLCTSFLSLKSPISNQTFLRIPAPVYKRRANLTNFRHSPVFMIWQDCKAKIEVDAPASVAYNLYLDREAIPKWMSWISSVKVLEDKPDLSRWTMKYSAFGRDFEFKWLSRNLQPIPNQKIHWRSLDGVPNRGAVRFYPKGPSSCVVELTLSYEVPAILAGVTSALVPLVEGLLDDGLKKFATIAKSYYSGQPKT